MPGRCRRTAVDEHYRYDGLARLTRLTTEAYTCTYDDFAWGLDAADSRLYSECRLTTGQDELYTYDTLHRLTRSERGDLDGEYSAVENLTRHQGYLLDEVGNWTRFYDDSAAAERRIWRVS